MNMEIGLGRDDGARAGDPRQVPARLRSLPSRLLTQVAMYADRLADDRFASAGGRRWHYALLSALEEFGPASQATLSRHTGIYRSDLVGMTSALAEDGLIVRAPDPADRRRDLITLTLAGRTRLRQLDRIVAAIQADLVAPLTESERHQLVELLTRLLDRHAESAAGARGRWRPRRDVDSSPAQDATLDARSDAAPNRRRHRAG